MVFVNRGQGALRKYGGPDQLLTAKTARRQDTMWYCNPASKLFSTCFIEPAYSSQYMVGRALTLCPLRAIATAIGRCFHTPLHIYFHPAAFVQHANLNTGRTHLPLYNCNVRVGL